MRIALVTDAWAPQINGVVRTLGMLIAHLGAAGHPVATVTPDLFHTIPCPTYPEIRLALMNPRRRVAALIDAHEAQAIHISTEGPLGMAARALCLARGLPFTTAFHTRFPEYVAARFRVPLPWTYAWLRRFHAPAKSVMVPTATVRGELARRGFAHLRHWGRGVDDVLFDPGKRADLGLPRPIFLYVGRVAVEKNLPSFLDLDLPGTKMVVGDGPLLDTFRRRYPAVRFEGKREGEPLARLYASADAFVFPSLTDTFGLVLLEAMASGLPVAAFPVAGPLDIVEGSGAGVLDPDLRRAALAALDIPRDRPRAFARTQSWSASAAQFLDNLAPFR